MGNTYDDPREEHRVEKTTEKEVTPSPPVEKKVEETKRTETTAPADK